MMRGVDYNYPVAFADFNRNTPHCPRPTMDKARRIASNLAKLSHYLAANPD
jgi:hypothetical protein